MAVCNQDWQSDTEKGRIARSSIELPPIHVNSNDITSEPYPGINHARQRDILPSILSNSPPGRSSTLPPLQRPLGNRQRNKSITKRSKDGHHKRQKSKGGTVDWIRRIQHDSAENLLRPGGPVKAMSAEPGDYGKRWEDLIDAAASATEDIDEDRTPVSSEHSVYASTRLTKSRFPNRPYLYIELHYRHFPNRLSSNITTRHHHCSRL